MTYKEMFDNNDIELFLQWCRDPLQEIVDRVQKSVEINEEKMFCYYLNRSNNFNCNGVECPECLLHYTNNQKLLEWLNKNSIKVTPKCNIRFNNKYQKQFYLQENKIKDLPTESTTELPFITYIQKNN